MHFSVSVPKKDTHLITDPFEIDLYVKVHVFLVA